VLWVLDIRDVDFGIEKLFALFGDLILGYGNTN
jgi:hypothetical protein